MAEYVIKGKTGQEKGLYATGFTLYPYHTNRDSAMIFYSKSNAHLFMQRHYMKSKDFTVVKVK